MLKRPLFLRLIASSLSFFLFVEAALTNVAQANIWEERQQAVRSSQYDVRSTRNFNSLSSLDFVPRTSYLARLSHYGSVRKTIQSAKESRGIILHIQDIHQNREAQENIAGAIRALSEKNQLGTVALEGAFGAIPLNFYQSYPHRDVVQDVAEYLLREQRISGPIKSLLTSTTPTHVVGIDDKTHYDLNVAAYRAASPLISQTKKILSTRVATIEAEKARAFSPELTAFDKNVGAYQRGELLLGDYLSRVASLDTAPQIANFRRAYVLEKSFNFDRVQTEQSHLIAHLVSHLSAADVENLTAVSLAYKSGDVSMKDFYGTLTRLCERVGFGLRQFPSLASYAEYVSISDQIQSDQLFREMAALETATYARLARTDRDRALIAESQRLRLAGKLVEFALTKEEWQSYQELSKGGLLLPLGEKVGMRGLNVNPFESFYREAEIRDQLMAKNFITLTPPLSPPGRGSYVNVLVTGGFHSVGIDQVLSSAGYTVVSFTPKLTKVEDEKGSAYLTAFAQEKTPLDKLFAGEKLFLAQKPMIADRMMKTLVDGQEKWSYGTSLRRLAGSLDLSGRYQKIKLWFNDKGQLERVAIVGLSATAVLSWALAWWVETQTYQVFWPYALVVNVTIAFIIGSFDKWKFEPMFAALADGSAMFAGFRPVRRDHIVHSELLNNDEKSAELKAFVSASRSPRVDDSGIQNLAADLNINPTSITPRRLQILDPREFELISMFYGIGQPPVTSYRDLAMYLWTMGFVQAQSEGPLSRQNLGRLKRNALRRLKIYTDGWDWLAGLTQRPREAITSNFLSLSVLEAEVLSMFHGIAERKKASDAQIAEVLRQRAYLTKFQNEPESYLVRASRLRARHRLIGTTGEARSPLYKNVMRVSGPLQSVVQELLSGPKKLSLAHAFYKKRFPNSPVAVAALDNGVGPVWETLLFWTLPFWLVGNMATGNYVLAVVGILFVVAHKFTLGEKEWTNTLLRAPPTFLLYWLYALLSADPALATVATILVHFIYNTLVIIIPSLNLPTLNLQNHVVYVTPRSLLLSQPYIKAFRTNSLILSESDVQELERWFNTEDVLLPRPELTRMFFGRLYIERNTRDASQKVKAWVEILSRKWKINEFTVNSLLGWLSSYKVDPAKVSPELLSEFLILWVTEYQNNKNLREGFQYVVERGLTPQEKLVLALTNIKKMRALFSDSFIRGDEIWKTAISGTPFFLAAWFGFADGPFGFNLVLGENINHADPKRGRFFRLGLDSYGDFLRVVTIKGIAEQSDIINHQFPEMMGICVGRALLHVAVKWAELNKFEQIVGLDNKLHPTVGKYGLNYLAIFKGFGMRQKSPIGPMGDVAHLRTRSLNPGAPTEKPGIVLLLKTLDELIPKKIEPRVTVDGERPADIKFNTAEMKLIENANPGTVERIKHVLTTSFSKLKEEVDYDRVDGRSVHINLSHPVEISGEKVAIIKIKGVVFDRGQTKKSYNHPDAQLINFNPLGQATFAPQPRIPTGGMTFANAQTELEGAAFLHERRVRGPVGLGIAHFKEDKAEDEGDLGAAILGVPAGMMDLNDKLHEVSLNAKTDPDGDMPFLRLTAHVMRSLFEEGLVHNQLHHGNIVLAGRHAYVMDNESLRDVSKMPEAQKFGYLMRGISNWISSIETAMPEKLKKIAVERSVRAFFSVLLKGERLKMFEKEIRYVVSMDNAQRSALFRDAQLIPLIDMQHPFVTLVKAAFPPQSETSQPTVSNGTPASLLYHIIILAGLFFSKDLRGKGWPKAVGAIWIPLEVAGLLLLMWLFPAWDRELLTILALFFFIDFMLGFVAGEMNVANAPGILKIIGWRAILVAVYFIYYSYQKPIMGVNWQMYVVLLIVHFLLDWMIFFSNPLLQMNFGIDGRIMRSKRYFFKNENYKMNAREARPRSLKEIQEEIHRFGKVLRNLDAQIDEESNPTLKRELEATVARLEKQTNIRYYQMKTIETSKNNLNMIFGVLARNFVQQERVPGNPEFLTKKEYLDLHKNFVILGARVPTYLLIDSPFRSMYRWGRLRVSRTRPIFIIPFGYLDYEGHDPDRIRLTAFSFIYGYRRFQKWNQLVADKVPAAQARLEMRKFETEWDKREEKYLPYGFRLHHFFLSLLDYGWTIFDDWKIWRQQRKINQKIRAIESKFIDVLFTGNYISPEGYVDRLGMSKTYSDMRQSDFEPIYTMMDDLMAEAVGLGDVSVPLKVVALMRNLLLVEKGMHPMRRYLDVLNELVDTKNYEILEKTLRRFENGGAQFELKAFQWEPWKRWRGFVSLLKQKRTFEAANYLLVGFRTIKLVVDSGEYSMFSFMAGGKFRQKLEKVMTDDAALADDADIATQIESLRDQCLAHLTAIEDNFIHERYYRLEPLQRTSIEKPAVSRQLRREMSNAMTAKFALIFGFLGILFRSVILAVIVLTHIVLFRLIAWVNANQFPAFVRRESSTSAALKINLMLRDRAPVSLEINQLEGARAASTDEIVTEVMDKHDSVILVDDAMLNTLMADHDRFFTKIVGRALQQNKQRQTRLSIEQGEFAQVVGRVVYKEREHLLLFFPKNPLIAATLRERLAHYGGDPSWVHEEGISVFQDASIQASALITLIQQIRHVDRSYVMDEVGIIAPNGVSWVFDNAADLAILNGLLLGVLIPQNLGFLIEFHQIVAKFA